MIAMMLVDLVKTPQSVEVKDLDLLERVIAHYTPYSQYNPHRHE
jgi:hypothetical protein